MRGSWLLLTLLAAWFAPAAHGQLIARGPWSGALTPYTAEVNLVLFESRLTSLEFSTLRDFSRFASVPEQARKPGDIPLLTRYKLNNLQPDTLYYYRVRAGNLREYQRIGRLHTPPLDGQPTSFRLAVTGGSAADSEAGGLAEVGYQKPLFFVQLGNLHDTYIAADDPTGFADAYLTSLGSFARADLLLKVPMVYTWDRYDSGEKGTATGLSAHRAFRQLSPHHPFPADQAPALTDTPLDQRPVAQAFTVGRVRCIVLDTRSARTTEGATSSLLGAWQNAWLREELTRSAQTHALTLLFSSVPWHAAANVPGIDSWANFPAERDALASWVQQQGLQRIILVSANTGTLAVNQGDLDPWSPPEFQVGDIAMLYANPPGGDWTQGPLRPGPTEEFFGLIDILDETLSITVTFSGMNQHGQEKLKSTLTFPVPRL